MALVRDCIFFKLFFTSMQYIVMHVYNVSVGFGPPCIYNIKKYFNKRCTPVTNTHIYK